MNRDFLSSVDRSIGRIHIFRPGAVGDTLLTFPAFRLLRDHFPAARITVVGNRPALRLAMGAGLVDAVDAFGAEWVGDLFGDEPTPALRDRLRDENLGIVWMHSADAGADLAARVAAAGVARAIPLVSFPAPGSRRHVADHLVDTLAELGIRESGRSLHVEPLTQTLSRGERELMNPRVANRKSFDLTLDPAHEATEVAGAIRRNPDRIESIRYPLPAGEGPGEGGYANRAKSDVSPLAVLHPGAGARRKRWPAERYAALGERLLAWGYRLAATCGPADEDSVAIVRSALGERIQILSGLELRDLAGILARARLVVGNDSGITHLAALVGAPTLAIFGPFDPGYWAPIGPRVAVVDAGYDCTHRQDPRDGCRQCDPLPRLDVEQVWEAVELLLAPPPNTVAPRGWYDHNQ